MELRGVDGMVIRIAPNGSQVVAVALHAPQPAVGGSAFRI